MINAKHTVLLLSGLFVCSTALADAPAMTWTQTLAAPTTAIATQPTLTWAATPTTTSLKIAWVETVDVSNLNVTFEWQPQSWISAWSEVKVLRDLDVASSLKDATNPAVLTVTMSWELDLSGNYSLLSLWDVDLNADFTLNGLSTKIDNKDAWADLTWKSIELVDAKTLKITFTKDFGVTVPIFKLLRDIKVETLNYDSSKLNVKLSDKLKKDGSYIFMVLGLKDNTGKDVEVENSLFDFKTPSVIVGDEELATTGTGETTMSGETSTGAQLAAVAMEASETPSTWTQENLIIILSLLLASWVFVFRKKSLKI